MDSTSSPLVSVIIATYNWSSVLRYALRCVIEQTFKNFEVLVVGDGCTDDSEHVVASFNDPRLRWFNLPANSGSQAAPNSFGLSSARGKYVAYLGHDDLWRSCHLQLLVDRLESSGADIAFTLAEIINPPDKRLLSGILVGETFGESDFVVPSSVMHTRALYAEIGGWSDHRAISMGVDAEFFQRARGAGKQFVSVDRLTVFKFPSAMRKDSYKLRSCEEQSVWYERMTREPEIERVELLAVARSFIRYGAPAVRIAPGTEKLPPGWAARQFRRVRGLEAGAEMPKLSDSLPHEAVQIAFVDLHLQPTVFETGSTHWFTAVIRNRTTMRLSSEGSQPVLISYHWFDPTREQIVRDGVRTVIFPEVGPEEQVVCSVRVVMPARAGTLTLELAAVQEGIRWFEPTADDARLVCQKHEGARQAHLG